MPRLRYTQRARESLSSIRRHLALESKELRIGIAYTQFLRRRCKELSRYDATIGTARPELGEGIRSFPEGNYVIFFRYIDGWFEVVNILEGHQDINSSHVDG